MAKHSHFIFCEYSLQDTFCWFIADRISKDPLTYFFFNYPWPWGFKMLSQWPNWAEVIDWGTSQNLNCGIIYPNMAFRWSVFKYNIIETTESSMSWKESHISKFSGEGFRLLTAFGMLVVFIFYGTFSEFWQFNIDLSPWQRRMKVTSSRSNYYWKGFPKRQSINTLTLSLIPHVLTEQLHKVDKPWQNWKLNV